MDPHLITLRHNIILGELRDYKIRTPTLFSSKSINIIKNIVTVLYKFCTKYCQFNLLDMANKVFFHGSGSQNKRYAPEDGYQQLIDNRPSGSQYVDNPGTLGSVAFEEHAAEGVYCEVDRDSAHYRSGAPVHRPPQPPLAQANLRATQDQLQPVTSSRKSSRRCWLTVGGMVFVVFVAAAVVVGVFLWQRASGKLCSLLFSIP